MRDIKFRAWSRENEEFIGDVIADGIEWLEDNHHECAHPIEIFAGDGEQFDVEQYTGVRDKNGKKIYEGDIVSVYDGDMLGVVKQAPSGAWAAWWDNVSTGQTVLVNIIDNAEVVGNVHENPELLEGGECTK